jgi:hypothetical protein
MLAIEISIGQTVICANGSQPVAIVQIGAIDHTSKEWIGTDVNDGSRWVGSLRGIEDSREWTAIGWVTDEFRRMN